MLSLLACPICGGALDRGEGAYACPAGHSYDIAREGYVHLLPANRKHAKEPGDGKAMAAARNRFLSKNYYDKLRRTICQLSVESLAGIEAPAVLDSGCGEGYYTAGVYQALSEAGRLPRAAGVDLSRPSLRWAARRERGVEFAVASAYHLPVRDASVNLVLNCFSPLALDEFRRVLKPGGVLLYVIPGPRHLWEFKEVLYDRPYPNPEEESLYEGFESVGAVPAADRMRVPGGDLMDLFGMTPYYWKTPKAGVERLAALDGLDVTAEFRVLMFRRENG